MALFPFILIKRKGIDYKSQLIFHERIHIRQQLELLVLPFYVLYFFNYLINLLRYKTHYKAYRNIIFEREAFENDTNPDYLERRRFWAFLSYL